MWEFGFSTMGEEEGTPAAGGTKEGLGLDSAPAFGADWAALERRVGMGRFRCVRVRASGGAPALRASESSHRLARHTGRSKLAPHPHPHPRPSPPRSIGGLGFGLPLSRVHARYFGGDLKLVSMQGYGVDVYLTLKRLEHQQGWEEQFVERVTPPSVTAA